MIPKYRIDLCPDRLQPLSGNKSVHSTDVLDIAKSVFDITQPRADMGVVLSEWSEYANGYITLDYKGFENSLEPEPA